MLAPSGRKHGVWLVNVIDADIARADDERRMEAARRECAVPVVRRAVRHRHAHQRWVVHNPAQTARG
jgi:hypothetical protein